MFCCQFFQRYYTIEYLGAVEFYSFSYITAFHKVQFQLKSEGFEYASESGSFLWMWSHLLKNSLMENFVFLCSETYCYNLQSFKENVIVILHFHYK